MDVPEPYVLLLLAAAAYRTFRLIGHDKISERPREWVLDKLKDETSYTKWDTFLRCPWCMGWWCILGWWGFWLAWHDGATFLSVPLAASALIGLTFQNLDG